MAKKFHSPMPITPRTGGNGVQRSMTLAEMQEMFRSAAPGCFLTMRQIAADPDTPASLRLAVTDTMLKWGYGRSPEIVEPQTRDIENKSIRIEIIDPGPRVGDFDVRHQKKDPAPASPAASDGINIDIMPEEDAP